MWKLILVLLVLTEIGCGSTQSVNPIGYLNKRPKPSEIDWNKAITELVEKRIQEKLKDCPSDFNPAICEQKARVYVEGQIWADVLESKWEIVDVWYKDKYVWVTIKRGRDIPVVGNIKVGEFDNIEDIFMVNGKLKVLYKTQAQINSEEKTFYSGLGFFSGVALVVILMLAL